MPKETTVPVQIRKTVSIDRLRRSSTMHDHIQVTTIPMPPLYGKQVEMMRLRKSFEGFVEQDCSPTAEIEGGGNVAKATGGGHDILLAISNAELIDLIPMESSWCAVLLIDNKAIHAINKFVEAGLRHFKETHMHSAFVSPFAEAAAAELPFAHLQVKISENEGKIMHSTFIDATGEILCKPGDEMLTLKLDRLAGPCSVTIHLAGYWYDSSKQGPLLYLTNVTKVDTAAHAKQHDSLEAPPSPSMHQLTKSPGGSVRKGFRLSMSPVPIDDGDAGSDKYESLDGQRIASYRFKTADDMSDSSTSEGEPNNKSTFASTPSSPNSQRLAEIKLEERSVSPPFKQSSYVRRTLKRESSDTNVALPASLLSQPTLP